MIARRSLGRRRASRTDREGGVLSAGDQPSGDEAGGDQIFEKRLQETAPVRPLAGEGDGLLDGLETVREQADAGPVVRRRLKRLAHTGADVCAALQEEGEPWPLYGRWLSGALRGIDAATPEL